MGNVVRPLRRVASRDGIIQIGFLVSKNVRNYHWLPRRYPVEFVTDKFDRWTNRWLVFIQVPDSDDGIPINGLFIDIPGERGATVIKPILPQETVVGFGARELKIKRPPLDEDYA